MDSPAPAYVDCSPKARRRRRTVADALVALCLGHPPDLPPDDEIARDLLVTAVRHHRLAPLAQVRLRDAEPSIAHELQADRDVAKERFVASTMLLGGLDDLLGDLPWLAFKGPVLSEHAHPISGLRSFNDLDILVSPFQLRDVAKRLIDAGWQSLDHGDSLNVPATPGEMHWWSPAGIAIDLHWSMINMARTRHRFPLVTDDLLAARVRVPVGLASTWTLAPADTLVHVCLHAAKTGANRMQMLLDADQLVRRTEDWDAVVRRARHWGAGPAVAIVLSRARAVLGTPTPTDLDQQLGVSPTFRLLNRAVNSTSPVPRLRRAPSLARLVARSARPGDFQTLRTVAGRSIEGVVYRLRSHEPRQGWDPEHAADPLAIANFADTVEREAAARLGS